MISESYRKLYFLSIVCRRLVAFQFCRLTSFQTFKLTFVSTTLSLNLLFVVTRLCRISTYPCNCNVIVVFYNLRRYSSLRINLHILIWSRHLCCFKQFHRYCHFSSAHIFSSGYDLLVAFSLFLIAVIINLLTPSRVKTAFPLL